MAASPPAPLRRGPQSRALRGRAPGAGGRHAAATAPAARAPAKPGGPGGGEEAAGVRGQSQVGGYPAGDVCQAEGGVVEVEVTQGRCADCGVSEVVYLSVLYVAQLRRGDVNGM